MNKLLNILSDIVFYPLPLRVLLFKKILKYNRWLPYSLRLEYDALTRPNYGFCIYYAAILARSLNIKRISLLEFGVAGGNGLVNMEEHAKEISLVTGVEFEIYGFDMGTGLPPPKDYRDMPYMWAEGFYKMDVSALQKRLTISKLVLGNVRNTIPFFHDNYSPAPIGCVMFDLDYYSSTIESFQIFNQSKIRYLPRVYCYFDDIASNALRAMNSNVGVLQAINEFNESGDTRKISRIEGLATSRKIKSTWNDHVFVFHDFIHKQYNEYIGNAHQSLDLE